ncbi:hypothetical protein QWZ08_11275 [Ferruginibacter paludis]|uniref:hypothetical protein n=1 Tax=Ferruginibacter paludis TaxID=1310417 RepID=UPI0025B4E544|nr:hypothetical protein [Ferruginibacter paludis]MDN3656212.1 hypothetical protein [Ferruginibacter paludis]
MQTNKWLNEWLLLQRPIIAEPEVLNTILAELLCNVQLHWRRTLVLNTVEGLL